MVQSLKHKKSKTTTKKNIKRNRQTCKYYHGGRNNTVPISRQQLRNDIKFAAETLNASIINLEQRTIVKNRLQLLYGTSETWKKLRREPNVPLPNSVQYETLPVIVKGYLQDLLDKILALLNSPHEKVDYNFIILDLIRNNLYHMSQDELNDENSNNNNNNSNNSSNYSNNRNNIQNYANRVNNVNNVMPMSNRNSNTGSHISDPK
jgi:hypothetical protein